MSLAWFESTRGLKEVKKKKMNTRTKRRGIAIPAILTGFLLISVMATIAMTPSAKPDLADQSISTNLFVNPSNIGFSGDASMVGASTWNLLWQKDINAGYGSIAIGTGKKNTGFVGSTDGLMYALNLNNGNTVWSHNIGSAVRSTPAITDEEIVLIADDGKAYALNPNDGSEIWNFTMRSGVQSKHYWSPAIRCDEVFVAANGMFYALDLETGAENWNYTFWASPNQLGALTYSSPAIDPENNLVIFGKRVGVFALDMDSGTLVWNRGDIDPRYGSPTVSHGMVFIGDFADDILYALNENDGTTVWSKSGIWADMPVAIAEIEGSPVAFFTDGYPKPSKIYAVNALNGSELWTYSTPNYMLFSGPSVAKIGGTYMLFIGGGYNYKLYALNAETGALLFEYDTADRVYTSPAITEIGGKPTVIFASRDGNVSALEITTGNVEEEPYAGVWPKFHRDNRNTGYIYICPPEVPELWHEINAELDSLKGNVSAADMPSIIQRRLIDKLEYAKELNENAKIECEAGNFDGATKKLGVAKSQVESFASMVRITRRISAADKASFLADAAEIIGKIQALIEYVETEHKC